MSLTADERSHCCSPSDMLLEDFSLFINGLFQTSHCIIQPIREGYWNSLRMMKIGKVKKAGNHEQFAQNFCVVVDNPSRFALLYILESYFLCVLNARTTCGPTVHSMLIEGSCLPDWIQGMLTLTLCDYIV